MHERKIKEVVITYSGEGEEVRRLLTAKQAKWVLGARKNKSIPKPRSLMGQAFSKSSEESYPRSESEMEESSSTEAGPFKSASVSSEESYPSSESEMEESSSTEAGPFRSASVSCSSFEIVTEGNASSSTTIRANIPKPRALLDSPRQVPKPRLDSYKIGELYDPLNIRPSQWRQRKLEHITIEKVYAPRKEREEEARYIRRLLAENGKTLDFCYHNGQGHVFYKSMQPQTARVSYYHNMNTGKKVSWEVSGTGARAKSGTIEYLPPTPIKGYKKK